MAINSISNTWISEVKTKSWGSLATADDSSIDTALNTWAGMRSLIEKSVTSGQTFTDGIVSTYSLVYTTTNAYEGGVLPLHGDIHFIPTNATRE